MKYVHLHYSAVGMQFGSIVFPSGCSGILVTRLKNKKQKSKGTGHAHNSSGTFSPTPMYLAWYSFQCSGQSITPQVLQPFEYFLYSFLGKPVSLRRAPNLNIPVALHTGHDFLVLADSFALPHSWPSSSICTTCLRSSSDTSERVEVESRTSDERVLGGRHPGMQMTGQVRNHIQCHNLQNNKSTWNRPSECHCQKLSMQKLHKIMMLNVGVVVLVNNVGVGNSLVKQCKLHLLGPAIGNDTQLQGSVPIELEPVKCIRGTHQHVVEYGQDRCLHLKASELILICKKKQTKGIGKAGATKMYAKCRTYQQGGLGV